MKKTFRTLMILFLTVLMLLTSCNDKLQKMEEGSVNEYIYPYIRFEKAEYGESAEAEVLALGNQPVDVPSSVVCGDKDLPVASLRVADGIKEIPAGSLREATSVKEIDLPDSVEKIGKGSLPSTLQHLALPEASIPSLPDAFPEGNELKEITVKGSGETVGELDLSNFSNLDKVNIVRPETTEPAVWPGMKPLEKEGYVFLGWYTENGTKITAGMKIEPGQDQAYPRWERKDKQSSGSFKVKIVYSYANMEGVVLAVTPNESSKEGSAIISATLTCPIENPRIEWLLNGNVIAGQTGLDIEVEITASGTNQISAYIYDSNGTFTAYAEAVITY